LAWLSEGLEKEGEQKKKKILDEQMQLDLPLNSGKVFGLNDLY
jgi:hypothetical protein